MTLTMEVGKLLQNAGYNVVYTRTNDIYNTPFEKATIANNSAGDLFVSVHRNSSAVPNQYSGIQTLVYNNQGIKTEIAKKINENLTALGFEDKGIVERPNLVVLKRTRMPAVLVEAGFINSDTDNKLFDENMEGIAQAIADGIIDTLNVTPAVANISTEQPNKMTDKEQYTVQTGAFRNRQLANRMAADLRSQGYPAQVMVQDGLYKVHVGSFENLDNSVALEQKLRMLGYNTFIRTH